MHDKKFISEQELLIARAKKDAAFARRDAAAAGLAIHQQRLIDTKIIASDAGVIVKRNIVLGSMSSMGQPMFNLMRQNRMEWIAEVLPEQLDKINVGMKTQVIGLNNLIFQGHVRAISPSLLNGKRLGKVYIAIDGDQDIAPGLYVTGQFVVGQKTAVLIPVNAIVQRDGRTFVLVINDDNTVSRHFVSLGDQIGEYLEILDGLQGGETIVSRGAGFLSDGDSVNINNAVQGDVL
jgi:RND family efflux transporter MFP subunit